MDPVGPDQARAADAQRAGLPERGSRDELRHRLDRLPPGHPSSTWGEDPGGHGLSGLDASRTGDGRPDGGRAREGHEPRAQDAGRSADTASQEMERAGHSFWGERPAFERAWAAHEARWPAERTAAAVDRSRDPAGSWRGDGGQYLTPEQHKQAAEAIARVQRTEEALTKSVTQAEGENTCGGHLEGPQFRRKGEDRLKEKIAEKLDHEPDKTPSDVIRRINDAIRYTFCFEAADYLDGYRDIQQRLEACGYKMIYSKNYWPDSEYKGINTRWATPEGQLFEVQFHTPESFSAKQEVTHGAYERLRNPLTSPDERQELEAFQREVCYWIVIPPGATSIPDIPRKGQ